MQRYKIKEGKYIAYFQAFTNTYAPVEILRKKYMEAVNHPDVAIISIGTRPDCLSNEILELLSEVNMIKPVWVELGLQTIHENSIDYIRRGYENSVYDKAVSELKSRGIYVVTHVILGLPNETEEMMLETVKYVCEKTDGIKLQLLHVIKGTDLEKAYLQGEFDCMTLDEYVEIIAKCVNIIPQNIAVHRLTGDGDKRTLVAPLWSGNKKLVLNTINKEYGAKLAEYLGITTATVSHHIETLKKAGLVNEEKIGTIKYFTADKEQVNQMFSALQQFLKA